METVKILTPATITRSLKKAGFTQSKWLASSRVRGWGSSTEGFEVEGEKITHYSQQPVIRSGRKYWPQRNEYTGRVFVKYQQSNRISAIYSSELQARKMKELETALKDMGYSVKRLKDYDGGVIRLLVERKKA